MSRDEQRPAATSPAPPQPGQGLFRAELAEGVGRDPAGGPNTGVAAALPAGHLVRDVPDVLGAGEGRRVERQVALADRDASPKALAKPIRWMRACTAIKAEKAMRMWFIFVVTISRRGSSPVAGGH